MKPRWQLIGILALGVGFLVAFRESGPTSYQLGVLVRVGYPYASVGLNIQF